MVGVEWEGNWEGDMGAEADSPCKILLTWGGSINQRLLLWFHMASKDLDEIINTGVLPSYQNHGNSRR